MREAVLVVHLRRCRADVTLDLSWAPVMLTPEGTARLWDLVRVYHLAGWFLPYPSGNASVAPDRVELSGIRPDRRVSRRPGALIARTDTGSSAVGGISSWSHTPGSGWGDLGDSGSSGYVT